MVLSDLGTCGGLKADERARVLREDGGVIAGLYAIGNTAANAFGTTYPGRAQRSRRAWCTATSRPATRRRVPARLSRSVICAVALSSLGLDLLFDLAPIARRGARFPETALGGLLA